MVNRWIPRCTVSCTNRHLWKVRSIQTVRRWRANFLPHSHSHTVTHTHRHTHLHWERVHTQSIPQRPLGSVIGGGCLCRCCCCFFKWFHAKTKWKREGKEKRIIPYIHSVSIWYWEGVLFCFFFFNFMIGVFMCFVWKASLWGEGIFCIFKLNWCCVWILSCCTEN